MMLNQGRSLIVTFCHRIAEVCCIDDRSHYKYAVRVYASK